MASRPGVLCRGLPYQADVEDVRRFFKSLDIPERNIEIMVCADGLGSGVCYVALRDDEEVKRAMLMDRNHIGTRYIDVMRADDDRVDHVRSALAAGASRNEVHRMSAGESIRRTQDQPVRDRSPIRLSPRILSTRTRCAYFRGLPDGCMYKDIRLFFKGVLIPKNSIHLIRDSSNRFRGDGYIEFANSEELKKALKLDGEPMEGSIIRVDPCSEDEMIDMMGYTERRGRSPAGSHDIYYQGYGGYGGRESGYNRSREPPAPSGGGYYNEPPVYGGGWSSFEEDKGRHGGYSRYYPHRSSNPYGRGFQEDERKPLDFRQTRVTEPPLRGSYGDQRRYEHPPMVSYPPPPSSIPQERKVVRVHGLSDTASAADVMAFFRDYGVQYEDVRLQCHDDGRPNGRAFVTFPTERLAQTAYRNLNHQFIRGNPIELFLV